MKQDDGFLTRWSRRKVQSQQPALAEKPPAERPPTAARTPAGPEVAAPSAAPSGSLPRAEADGPEPAAHDPVAPPRPTEPLPPTLADAQGLTPDADFTRFVGRSVDPGVRNTALKTLFSDPRYNVMDGLDIYIDDYSRPDPLPPGMLRKMAQSTLLGLFAGESDQNAAPSAAKAATGDTVPTASEALPGAVASAPTDDTTDEDTDLRLQPDDDAGRAGAEPGPGEDSGRQC